MVDYIRAIHHNKSGISNRELRNSSIWRYNVIRDVAIVYVRLIKRTEGTFWRMVCKYIVSSNGAGFGRKQ